ncbi:hypothetical protein C0971_00920 [Bacillus methanolicus]|nr:hypothetical protein C0971_00920 [Bacillus methanolicus]
MLQVGKVVPFRTREEWEIEKQEKMKAEWEAYLEWEEETLRKTREEREMAKSKLLNELLDDED